ncbi:MAG: exopolysaccharide biosynthesis protein, partial [Chromatiales bacterium]|nr:exopolysaccharide biosynthesis protein [Chromatiales bacterium]
MERIQKALEQATQQRAQVKSGTAREPSTLPEAQSDKPKFTDTTVDLSTGIFYSQTKVIEVPEQTLLDNRLIAALPDHPYKDAYRMLRTRVLQTLRANNWNTLAVTGPASGCGKTLTATNLAISLAMEMTNTVLLVDLDLRKPSVHKYFGFEPDKGLSDYLAKQATLPEILVSPGIARLVVLPGREALPNSSEMLRSPTMVALVNELKHRYPERI